MSCIVPSGCIHTCDWPNYCDYNAKNGSSNSSRNSSRLKNRRCELTLSLATLSIHDFILFQFESEMKCFHNLFKNNLKWKKACFRCFRDQLVGIVGVIRKDTLLICRIIPHGKKFNLTFTLIIFFHVWIAQWRQIRGLDILCGKSTRIWLLRK